MRAGADPAHLHYRLSVVARYEQPSAEPGPAGPQPESTARKAFVSTVVAILVIVLTLALWKLKVIIALLFVSITLAAAMRPGVEFLAKYRIPRVVGVLLHYVVFLALVAVFLSFVVPHLVSEVQAALNSANSGQSHAGEGFKGKVLDEIGKRLNHLPSAGKLIHPALSYGETAVTALVGVLFTLAAAAYWIFERDATVDMVASLVQRPKRKKLRDTWELIDRKLGAFVRGEILLIFIVATLVSTGFYLIGEPYWLLLGITVAILEIVPVIGPLLGIALAVGAGLTVSWHTAVYAGAVLLGVRVLQDYIVNPRVLGGIVGISPLIVLISVAVTDILFGGFYVLLAVPLASLAVTVIDVVLRGVEPADAEVPAVLFAAKDTETT
jgi:predicted PurR-regulated permease PerM